MKELDKNVKRYTKKPVTIEAVIWSGNNLQEVMQFCSGDAAYELMSRGNSELVISTLEDGGEWEARHIASVGDYIIKGVKGEFYPCKPDVFVLTYESEGPAVQPTQIDGAVSLQSTGERPDLNELNDSPYFLVSAANAHFDAQDAIIRNLRQFRDAYYLAKQENAALRAQLKEGGL